MDFKVFISFDTYTQIYTLWRW